MFLDEVGETSLPTQAKLLRVIQTREIQRVGSPEVKQINVRLIAATNRDLCAEVLAGRFREDLFYRLSSIQIRIPSLAERLEDIPLLVQFFFEEIQRSLREEDSRADAAVAGSAAAASLAEQRVASWKMSSQARASPRPEIAWTSGTCPSTCNIAGRVPRKATNGGRFRSTKSAKCTYSGCWICVKATASGLRRLWESGALVRTGI